MPKKKYVKSPKNESKANKQYRVCLACDKEFKSTGPGNRICSNCDKNQRTYISETTTYKIYPQSKGVRSDNNA